MTSIAVVKAIHNARDKMTQFKCILMRRIVCRRMGHYSTGTMLWWMCDRCHADFKEIALPSEYFGDVKVTRSH